MKNAVDAGEIETIATRSGKAIVPEEVMAIAVDLWSLERIEEALGPDASKILPEAIRTRELPARLPRYQVAMLEYFAERGQTSVSNVLARELEDLASAHFEELSLAVHGFAEAFEWPRQDGTQRSSPGIGSPISRHCQHGRANPLRRLAAVIGGKVSSTA